MGVGWRAASLCSVRYWWLIKLPISLRYLINSERTGFRCNSIYTHRHLPADLAYALQRAIAATEVPPNRR